MSATIIKAGLLIAAIINLLPLIGVLSKGHLEKLYRIPIDTPDLEVLMRHRAILFGLVGGFLLVSIFKTQWQMPAIAMGLISMVSFIVLTMMVSGYSGAYRHIVIADLIGIIALLVAMAFMVRT